MEVHPPDPFLTREADHKKGVEKHRTFLARYGATILRGGIAAIPAALYRYQGELGLSLHQVWFISSILSHKWDADLPHPSLKRMAAQTRVGEKYLHQYKNELIKAGWLTIIQRQNWQGGQDTNFYDFSALFRRLEELLEERRPPDSGGYLSLGEAPPLSPVKAPP